MMDRLLTARETSELLRIHLVTLYSWVSEGKIPSVKLGRKRLFVPGEIERWLQEKTVRGQGDPGRLQDLVARRRGGRRSGGDGKMG